MKGIVIPPEFLRNPQFYHTDFGEDNPFRMDPVPPTGHDPLQDLIDVMEDDKPQDNDIGERPHRNRITPKFYQSEVIESEEKLARKGKEKASSSNSRMEGEA